MRSKRIDSALLTALLATLYILLVTTSAMAQKGKGGGGGKNDGGGSDSGGSLPDGLTTRYLVQQVPLPADRTIEADNALRDVNESCVAVGYYVDAGGFYVGYRFDGITGVMETSSEMLDLSGTDIMEVAFLGINNFGAIVGYAGLLDGTVAGIVVTADGSGGWNVMKTESPYVGCDYFYGRKINDSGDIVGQYRDAAGNTIPYACNPGIYSTDEFNLYLAPKAMEAFGRSNGISNTRFAIGGTSVVFDFVAASIGLPATTDLPQEEGLSFTGWISNDGQVVANRSISKGKDKGDYVEVYQNGTSRSFGPIKISGDARIVNSRSGENPVGDILIKNTARRLSLLHADWGLLVLDEMTVFDDAGTDQNWKAGDILYHEMSDRLLGEFPCIGTQTSHRHFLLTPIEP